MKGEHTAAGEAPRMKLDPDGHWRGRPRMPVDQYEPAFDFRVNVYMRSSPPRRAQISVQQSSWSMEMYSRPDQLREMAALFTEAANLIDMLALVDRSAADHEGPDPEDADSEIAAAEVTP